MMLGMGMFPNLELKSPMMNVFSLFESLCTVF